MMGSMACSTGVDPQHRGRDKRGLLCGSMHQLLPIMQHTGKQAAHLLSLLLLRRFAQAVWAW